MFSVSTPRTQAPSASVVTIQTLRGFGEIQLPTLAQKPLEVGSAEPNAGVNGQNIHRPKITSRAGSSVIIASKVTPTPIAATGPRPAVEFISASVRQSIPTITVPALAMIAGVARCRANAIAS